jgi:hypothetical protein
MKESFCGGMSIVDNEYPIIIALPSEVPFPVVLIVFF